MEVAAADLARVPAENLHAPRKTFGDIWTVAQARQIRPELCSWYGSGVLETCRWLAQAVIRPASGPGHLAPAPITPEIGRAMPELIAQECLAAKLLSLVRPVPAWVAERPGWLDGVVDTFRWAWLGTGPPPILGDTRME